MSLFVIEGQNKLSGEVNIHGAKNSILPILAATVLVKGDCVIENCPMLSDVDTSLKILKHLGIDSKTENGVITVSNNGINKCDVPYELMNKMRSSVVFSGAILGALNEVKITNPGGCEIGKRPIDLHIKALKALGAELTEEDGYLYFTAKGGLTGTTINFPFKSVGATENAVLAAALAKGETVINNAATEPEIIDLANFLNSCGAKITGAGTEKIVIEGVYTLHPCVHRIIPDRIVAATYMSAAAVTDGTLLINRVNVNHLESVISAYKTAGCNIKTYDNSIEISSNGLRAIDYTESNV
ncbi:MAG: UDP-N-acetylglucosamine 1-carboxyvinyltransferase, partial [Clostridia bacterium]|nr:UDP-N-acetylglucosamine 1-carboxyvinyltransferase [Clostridia bacterium]